jgi:hypothetical protein
MDLTDSSTIVFSVISIQPGQVPRLRRPRGQCLRLRPLTPIWRVPLHGTVDG